MTQRNQRSGLLRSLDSGNAGGGKNVAFCDAIGGDQFQRGLLQFDLSTGDGFTIAERLAGNIDHARTAIAGKMSESFHCSAADRDHLAPGLISGAKIMLFRFARNDIKKKLPQLFVTRTGAQRRHDIELEITPEARSQFSIAG